MKHAGATALGRLADLLVALRRRPELVEKRPGVFYRRGRAFLHFHEDPAGLFADFRPADEWQRLRVETPAEASALIAALDEVARAR